MRLYRLLLRLLPSEMRDRFGAEMAADFEAGLKRTRTRGTLAVAAYWSRATGDIVRTSLREFPGSIARLTRESAVDLGEAARSMRRQPLFVAGTALVLALGIGVAVSVYSVAHSVLFKPLPYPDSDRLVSLWDQIAWEGEAFWTPEITVEHLRGIRSSTVSFDRMAGYDWGTETLLGEGDPDYVRVAYIQPALLEILSPSTHIGRLMTSEDVEASRHVALLDHRLWVNQYGSDEGILGRSIRLGEDSPTVVGVLSDGFSLPGFSAQVYVPIAADPSQRLTVIGRVADGVDPQTAREELRTYFTNRDEARAAPGTSGRAAQYPAVGLLEDQVAGVRASLLALLGAAILVLLIACANAANLLLVRALRRWPDLATRLALGAGRGRLTRTALAESYLVTILGGSAGTLLSIWLVWFFVSVRPAGIPRMETATVDPQALGFALLATLVVGLLAGLAPMVGVIRGRSMDLGGARKASADIRAGSIRGGLIVVEVALAVVLLAGSGLMLRTLTSLHSVDLGFDPSNLLTWSLRLPDSEYPDSAARTTFVEGLRSELLGSPAVESVAFGSMPVGTSRSATWLSFPEEEVPPGFTGSNSLPGFGSQEGRYAVNLAEVSRDYFDLLGMAVVAGRLPDPVPEGQQYSEILISEVMAQELWGGTETLGRSILRGARRRTVTGIVRDVHYGELVLDNLPTLYVLFDQQPQSSSFNVMVRTNVLPESFSDGARAAVWSIDPRLPLRRLISMEDQVAYWTAEARFYSLLFGAFALAALLLTVAGTYGVVSHAVSQRTREIGIRIALGATGRRIRSMVLRQSVLLAAIGLGIGLAAAVASTRVLRGLLFGVGPTDLVSLGGSLAVLLLTVLAATYLPAMRATRIDPVDAMRQE